MRLSLVAMALEMARPCMFNPFSGIEWNDGTTIIVYAGVPINMNLMLNGLEGCTVTKWVMDPLPVGASLN